MIIFTLHYRPMNSPKDNIFETFNESTLLVITYHLWSFTQMVQEAETRYELGYAFIGVTLGHVAVHFVFMVY